MNILASTGKGLEEEEKNAWQGWWNESIVDLVRLSMGQKDVLNVLLTGRNERGFADLISRMIKSKELEFNMVCLKPLVGPANQKIGSTMSFKQELLKDLVFTYEDAEEIRIYEDRPKQYVLYAFFTTAQPLTIPQHQGIPRLLCNHEPHSAVLRFTLSPSSTSSRSNPSQRTGRHPRPRSRSSRGPTHDQHPQPSHPIPHRTPRHHPSGHKTHRLLHRLPHLPL